MRVALLFIDGVGIGPNNPDTNPLARREHLVSRFSDGSGSPLPAGGAVTSVETTFGVEGRPQSASNQTALYTGVEAPKLIGEHRLGYPDDALKAMLARDSIVKRVVEAGRPATFANAYPREYLLAFELPHQLPDDGPADIELTRRFRHVQPSASTLAFAAAHVPLRSWADARAGKGLTHDIDGAMAHRRGLAVPRRDIEEAAGVFWSLASDFTLFEHYLADEAAHRRDFAATLEALDTFDAFARAVIAKRPADTAVLVVSDHGNVEDLTIRQHTRNPVALLCFGAQAPAYVQNVADVGRWVVELTGASS